MRQPSYTELNYESPHSLGNTGLERQHTCNTETGYKGNSVDGHWKLSLFYERTTESVAWVKSNPESRWSAVNLAESESYGAEALAAIEINNSTELSGSVLLLEKEISGNYYAGRYALDYPQFSGNITLKKQISRELMLALTQVVSKYEYNPVREGDSWLKETTIKMQWMLPFVKQLALNAGICNLFDDKFQFYPGQDSIGRSVYSSLTYNW